MVGQLTRGPTVRGLWSWNSNPAIHLASLSASRGIEFRGEQSPEMTQDPLHLVGGWGPGGLKLGPHTPG